MKILLVSMNSIHFRRWSEQLKDSDHEVYWFDILDQGYAPSMSWMTQITGWKKGFLQKRGRTALKKFAPSLFNSLSKNFDTKVDFAFAKALEQIKPDVVHSFALYISCAPILSVMIKNPTIKWIYSSWGSDLFYFQNDPPYLSNIKAVLPHIDYFFADCKRDIEIANSLGFSGEILGVFPGGGGFDLNSFDQVSIPFKERNVILVKGYENRSGRALNVLKALNKIISHLESYDIIIFGVENAIIDEYVKKTLPSVKIIRHISHDELLVLFGKAKIYIGNSNSDGVPNTLLESICAGAFPIQSNPGGVTEEVITNDENGLLIEDCEDIMHIATIIKKAIENNALLHKATSFNNIHLRPSLSYETIKSQILECYAICERR